MRSRWNSMYSDSNQYPVIKNVYNPDAFADTAAYHRCRKVAQEILNSMIYLPKGNFFQGCKFDEDIECDHRAFAEKPRHYVEMEAFFMGNTEITQRQWREVMGYNPSKNKGCDDCPVEQVSWNEVQGFWGILNTMTGLAFKLPTESEWEYASKLGDSNVVLGKGDTSEFKKIGWFYLNSGEKTHVVGTKMPSVIGIYDMHGNVREWCDDLYAIYPKKNKEIVPMKAGWRSLRGGSWYDECRKCRSTYRFYQNSDEKSEFVGFRLVLH
ncbi:MAG: formylglycine-generating enzyme family protein [Sphingomonadales bacterium]